MLSKIKQAFNHAAQTYDAAARVQHAVGAHLIQCLPKNTYASILDLGCGTGYTTQALANQIRFNTFYALDIAPEALNIARNTCQGQPIQFIETDFNQDQHTHPTDLIFSNMALHWSPDLKALFARCHNRLNKTGVFAFSLPLANTFHELNGLASKRTLPALADVVSLSKKNFKLLHHETKQYHSSHENTLACLRAIKKTGATFVDDKPHTRITKKLLHEKNITQLTYEIGFFIGQKLC